MPYIVTDKSPRPFQTVVSWIVAILSAGYMVPWAIAATRGKSNTWTIFWINLLLGWSIVGWIVALVMSLNSHSTIVFRD